MTKIIRLIIAISLIISLTGCGYKERVTIIETKVAKKDIAKATKGSSIISLTDGGSLISESENPERYIVILSYKDHNIMMNDKTLYDSVHVGDLVKLAHIEWVDAKGWVVHSDYKRISEDGDAK